MKPHLRKIGGNWRCSSRKDGMGPFIYGQTMREAYAFWKRAFG